LDAKLDQNPPLTFSVTDDEAGERLDSFLAARIQNWSRARLQRLIEDSDVLVNGHIAKSSYKTRAHDEIEIELTSLPSASFAPEEIPIEIVHEDDDLIVVNKPAGMVVHPAAGSSSGTLANALAFHFRELSTAAGAVRPGIVHRLDKGTSGLLVVAKTEVAHEDLANQFRSREVFKSYVALVHGQMERKRGEIDQPIGRDARNRTRMAVVAGGRSALSLFQAREAFDRFTRLEVELKTGRTHQIRVHLAWMKHPVVGDAVYGGGRDKTVPDAQVRGAIARLQRQFLHAQELGFRHPRTRQDSRFTAPLPSELQHLLELIRDKQSVI
jgi:23S rRNA pseudouridine1911/1915/1917 synthase